MNPLVPCPSCDRHVRSSEAACPFCDAALPADLASRAVPPATRRLNRAAAFTFAASIAIASASVSTACGGVVDTGTSTDEDAGGFTTMYGGSVAEDSGIARDGGVSANDSGSPGAMYGIARFDSGSPEDDGGVVAAYGLPFPEDAGIEPGPPDDGGIVAAYGLPSH